MSSHFEAIGLSLSNREELAALCKRVVESGERRAGRRGDYFVWSPGGGAQMWVQVGKDGRGLGANPHFLGSRTQQVQITSWDEDKIYLEARCHAQMMSDGQEIYPLIFDCPNCDEWTSPATPFSAQVQIAAFAHSMEWFADEAAFSHTHPQFAPQFFVPSGLLGEEPRPMALLAGLVLKSESISITDGSFLHLEIETYGAIYDLVIAPQDAPPGCDVGGIIYGEFYLSGLITEIF